MADLISQKGIENHLFSSLPVYVFESLDSTNRFAKTLTEDFALVVADCQTNGRGRLNRSFFSPKGTGIYFSLKVKIPHLYENVPFITTAAAVAVHRAITAVSNVKSGIKWVNDIYIGNKKLSGILCEAVDDCHVVIGIGINYTPSSLPDDLTDIVTFLYNKEPLVTRNEIIALIVDNLLDITSDLSDTSFMEYYKTHSIVIGKKVLCIQGENSFEATVLDIDNQGGLLVKTASGIKTLSSGEITLRLTN